MQVLKNIGKKSTLMLQSVGIDDISQLRQMGSVVAYLRVKKQYLNASLNLLWAIEGALTDCDWKTVAREERMRLLMELEDYKNREKNDQNHCTTP